jgi:hypothetical protein
VSRKIDTFERFFLEARVAMVFKKVEEYAAEAPEECE